LCNPAWNAAAADFDERRLFSEFCLKQATIFNHHALVVHCRLYIALAVTSARAHPARLLQQFVGS